MYELIGYLGSVIIAVSLLMRNVYKLRVVNMIGACFFVVYGYLINAPAVWLVNLFIAVVDLYYIYDLKKKPHLFRFIPMNYNDLIESFINSHMDDIVVYFPNLDRQLLEKLSYYLIVRNFVVVGIFGFRYIDDGNIEVVIDYIVKDWRDFKNAVNFFNYVSSNLQFKNKIFHTFSSNKYHNEYLMRMGFKKVGENKFILEL